VGVIGAGWPGQAHARGYVQAGGFRVAAVADLIPERRAAMLKEHAGAREYASAEALLADPQLDVVSVCLPTHLHGEVVCEALRGGRHVLCETPPATSAKEVGAMQRAAERNGKVLLFAMQRRFGAFEQAARRAAEKQFLGEIYHIRAAWLRTRSIPIGTGWYTSREQAGGGAMADLGLQMLDFAWSVLGDPKPLSVFACCQRRIAGPLVAPRAIDVEEAGTALVRFEGGKTLELSASWAMNQPPQQQGTICRISGREGAMEVYAPGGAILYRDFAADGNSKQVPLKGPAVAGHHALVKHFKDCIAGKATPQVGAARARDLLELLAAMYKSDETGKSVSM
jgi:predicted dehydrogenase